MTYFAFLKRGLIVLFWTEHTENKMENNALLSDLHILLTISGPDQFKFLNIIFRNKYLKITLIQVSAVWKLRKAPSLLLITYIVRSPSIHVEDCNTSSQKTRNSLRNLLIALEYERKLKQPTIVLTTVNIKITSH